MRDDVSFRGTLSDEKALSCQVLKRTWRSSPKNTKEVLRADAGKRRFGPHTEKGTVPPGMLKEAQNRHRTTFKYPCCTWCGPCGPCSVWTVLLNTPKGRCPPGDRSIQNPTSVLFPYQEKLKVEPIVGSEEPSTYQLTLKEWAEYPELHMKLLSGSRFTKKTMTNHLEFWTHPGHTRLIHTHLGPRVLLIASVA